MAQKPIWGATGGSGSLVVPSSNGILVVTIATAVFLSALDFRGPRNKLVMVDLEFPSLQYLYHRHPDAEIVTVKSRDGVGIR